MEPDQSPAGFRLRVAHNATFDDWAALSEGAYLLRSNINNWSDRQLWKAYIQLTQAEAAFRIHKDQLSVRPIWHQREERVQAHILVCFLAFVLWKSLEMWRQRAGLGNSPRAILEGAGAHSVARRRPADRNHTARFACAASLSRTPPKPRFSTASASFCPSACASHKTRRRPSHSLPELNAPAKNVVATFSLRH
ncbi:MAG: hypothetical protein ABSC25_01585 [Roseiarcus sp.]